MQCKNNIFLFSLVSIISLFPFGVLGQEDNKEAKEEIISAFKTIYDVNVGEIATTSLVEVPVNITSFSSSEVVVYEKGDEGVQQPAKLFSKKQEEEIGHSVVVEGRKRDVLSDALFSQYYEFPLRISGDIEMSEVELVFESDVSLEGITLHLFPNVALPNFVEVEAVSGNENSIILAKKEVVSRSIVFPKTRADMFVIRLYHSQPLRLTEIDPLYESERSVTQQAVRFLAQPGQSYEVYVNADRYVSPTKTESPQFFSDDDIVRVLPSQEQENVFYSQADGDGDGIPDEMDNCVSYANPSQEDKNKNGRGDACDDFDKDGVVNAKDNCINDPNRNQSDKDLDGIGDVCDKEESRFFEKYSWILPVSIGLVVLIVVLLMIQTIRTSKK